MTRAAPLRALPVLAALALAGCLRLDVFLFQGEPVADDVNLMANAPEIPADLLQELRGPVVAADGTVVDAYYAAHRADDGTPVARHATGILYCHGNAANIGHYAPRVQALWRLGWSVLVFDYPGYGKTKGTTTEDGVYAATRAAYDWLKARPGLQKVDVYGWSLGSAAAAQLAVEKAPPLLALESPFRSVAGLADDSAAVEAPGEWFADAVMDTVGKIPRFTGGLLVLHGKADTFVRPANGQAVYDAALGHANPAWLDLVDGATHSTVPCVSHDDPAVPGGCNGGFTAAYEQTVGDFFDGRTDGT
jgi:hypothetical protein